MRPVFQAKRFIFYNLTPAVRTFGLFFLGFVSLLPSCSADASFVAKASDDYFKPLLTSGRIAAAACVIVDGDRPPVVKLYGPVSSQGSLWRMASVSKVFTAIAIMQLAERGQLQLDLDVNRYLKHIQVPKTFPQPITIRQLLLHRSGLDDRFVGDGFHSGLQPTISQLMSDALPMRVYPPDTVELYSNYAYSLLGVVIEDVTGQRFEDYVKANVLEPMGMRESTFTQPLPEPSRMVPGRWFYQRAAPAAALTSTVDDMTRFLLATLRKDKPVLEAHSFEEMTVPPEPAIRILHGLGYWTGNDRGHHLVGASGDSGGFHSVLMAFPDEHIGYFTLVSGGGNSIAWDFYERFATPTFGPKATAESSAGPVGAMTRENGSRYAGFYRTVRYPHHDLSKTFILLNLTRVSVDHEGALRVYGARWLPIGQHTFRKENGSETLSFQTDESGRVRFLNSSDERITWYETGYANIAFYFIFVGLFVAGVWKGKAWMRWISAVVLLHCAGFLSVCLIIGPENLIFGLPLALKAILLVGTLLPLLALASVLAAWRDRKTLNYILAATVLAYIPFVSYWNLKL
jgi:CubicO group peptidase (beta-lactamase class C family)